MCYVLEIRQYPPRFPQKNWGDATVLTKKRGWSNLSQKKPQTSLCDSPLWTLAPRTSYLGQAILLLWRDPRTPTDTPQNFYHGKIMGFLYEIRKGSPPFFAETGRKGNKTSCCLEVFWRFKTHWIGIFKSIPLDWRSQKTMRSLWQHTWMRWCFPSRKCQERWWKWTSPRKQHKSSHFCMQPWHQIQISLAQNPNDGRVSVSATSPYPPQPHQISAQRSYRIAHTLCSLRDTLSLKGAKKLMARTCSSVVHLIQTV